MVAVEVGEVVEAVPGEVFHYEDAGAGPDDTGDDERAFGVGGEVGADAVNVVGFVLEVEFLGEAKRGLG